MAHFSRKKCFIPLITILCLCSGIFALDMLQDMNSGPTKKPALKWQENKITFPLRRNLSLTYLNKPINVNAAHQLPNGLVEIYSRDAILLFDGNKVVPFRIPGHPDQHPRMAVSFGKTKFYIGRDDHLFNDDSADPFSVKIPVDTNARYRGMIRSDRHVVIAASDGNIFIFDPSEKKFQTVRLPVANEIFAIVNDRLHQIWVATDGGLFVYKIIDKKFELIKHLNQSNSVPDNLCTSIAYDGKKTLVVGSYESGLFTVNTDRFTVTRFNLDIKNRIDHISVLDADHIVLSVENKGILLANPLKNTFTTLSKSTVGREIRSMCILDEGWIAVFTKEGDVMMVNPVISTIQPGLKGLQCLAQNQENLYLGTSHGLYIYNHEGKPTPVAGTRSLNIVSLYQDSHGSLWIGTYGQGLYRWISGKLKNIDLQYKIDKNIMSMDGNNNKIYLATLSGAYAVILDKDDLTTVEEVKSYQQDQNIGARFIYSVNVDESGVAWFGSDGKGLWKLVNEELTPVFKEKYGDRSVQSVYTQGDNLLINLDGSEFDQISKNSSGTFKLNYKTGNISGFTAVDEEWSCMYSEGKLLLTNSVQNRTLLYDHLFDERSFVPTLNSACDLSDGSSLICTDDEIIMVANTAFIKRTRPLTVFHSVIPVASGMNDLKHDFKYNENTIEINYSGIWYNDPEKVSFRYRLKNYEEQFKTTLDNHIFYTNLPPGKYSFEIESVCEQVDTIPNIASYEITVSKPYYGTWWFRLLALTALVTAIYFIVKSLERNKQKKQKLESEKLEAQISILKSQINPHFLFNSFNTLTALIEENPKNAHLYIDKLSSFYRALLTINGDTHTIGEELTILHDFYFLLKQRFGDNLDLEVNIADDSGLIPPLTFQLLFENVINHNVISRTRPMRVIIIQQNDGSIIFSNIKQRKSVKTPGTGIGLENIRNRFRLMFGKELIVRDGKELFEVILPFAKKMR